MLNAGGFGQAGCRCRKKRNQPPEAHAIRRQNLRREKPSAFYKTVVQFLGPFFLGTFARRLICSKTISVV